MRIGEIAHQAKVPAKTIRFGEAEGLLPALRQLQDVAGALGVVDASCPCTRDDAQPSVPLEGGPGRSSRRSSSAAMPPACGLPPQDAAVPAGGPPSRRHA
jgi:hypothetical protein